MAHVQHELSCDAIEVLHVTARAGLLTWVTGENGAGKSRLLRELARSRTGVGRTAYYHPTMGAPLHVTVADWLRLNEALLPADSATLLGRDDEFFPRVNAAARMTKLSTGEAKRLLLWSLLRMFTRYTFLDEPYEHLSPAAKARLTSVLRERSRNSIVVVATNQEIPAFDDMQIVEIE